MQSFLGMMIDRCGKVLKIAPCSASVPLFDLPLPSRHAAYSRHVEPVTASSFRAPEEIEQSPATLRRLLGSGLMRRNVGQVDADDIGDRDLVNVALAARRRVLARDVVGEGLFSLMTFARAESSADLSRPQSRMIQMAGSTPLGRALVLV